MLLLDGRSVAWLAEASGLEPRTVGDIIKKTTPSATKAVSIAEALGTTVEYLMKGESAGSSRFVREGGRDYSGREKTDDAEKRIGDRMRRARLTVEEATQEVAYHPSEALYQAMLTIQFRYDVTTEDLALLLAAIADQKA